jgi:hypothetical protein
MHAEQEKTGIRFKTTDRANIPTSRKGKHHAIVAAILNDLNGLRDGKALKIPLSDLPDTTVNIRSALNRATRKVGRDVATATDETFLYIWNGSSNGNGASGK